MKLRFENKFTTAAISCITALRPVNRPRLPCSGWLNNSPAAAGKCRLLAKLISNDILNCRGSLARISKLGHHSQPLRTLGIFYAFRFSYTFQWAYPAKTFALIWYTIVYFKTTIILISLVPSWKKVVLHEYKCENATTCRHAPLQLL